MQAFTVEWSFDASTTAGNAFDEKGYKAELAALLGDDFTSSDITLTPSTPSSGTVAGTVAFAVAIDAPTSAAAQAAASRLQTASTDAIQATGATSMASDVAPAVKVQVVAAPSPPSPLASGKRYEATLSFTVKLDASRLRDRRLEEATTTATAAQVAAAVEAALAAKGQAHDVTVTGPDSSETFNVSMIMDGPQCEPVSDVIVQASFAARLATEMGSPVVVSEPSCAIEIVDAASPPAAPPSPPPPSPSPPSVAPPTPASPIGNVDGGPDRVDTGDDDDDDGFPIWAIVLIVIILILLCPLLLVCYATMRFGPDNVPVWFRYRFCHTNPTLPAFYMPREDRERIKKQLGLGGSRASGEENKLKEERV